MYIFPHCVLKNMGARDYAVNIMGRSSVCILNPSDNLGQREDPWCYCPPKVLSKAAQELEKQFWWKSPYLNGFLLKLKSRNHDWRTCIIVGFDLTLL